MRKTVKATVNGWNCSSTTRKATVTDNFPARGSFPHALAFFQDFTKTFSEQLKLEQAGEATGGCFIERNNSEIVQKQSF